jgi:hypothetical protein
MADMSRKNGRLFSRPATRQLATPPAAPAKSGNQMMTLF